MNSGTTSIEIAMACTPLAIVSSPRVGPIFSSCSGVGVEGGRQAAGLEDLDQVVDLLEP